MNPAQWDKVVIVTPPGAIVDNASLTTASIDTKGYNYARILVVFGAMDIAMSALKVQESDDDSTYADITGLVYGTSTDIAGSTSALPSATADNTCYAFEANLNGRKRYLDVVATCGDGAAGTYVTVIALLSRAADGPVTKTERGFANILRV